MPDDHDETPAPPPSDEGSTAAGGADAGRDADLPAIRRVRHDERKRRLRAPRDLFSDMDEDDAYDDSGDDDEPEPDPASDTDPASDGIRLHAGDVDAALGALANFDAAAASPATILPAERPAPKAPVPGRYPPIDPAREPAAAASPAVEAAPPRPGRTRGQPGRSGLYNAVALLFALLTVAVFAYYSVLWRDPYSALNPFPPATPFIVVTATPAANPGAALLPTPAPATPTAPLPGSLPTVEVTPEVAAPVSPAAPPESPGLPIVLSDADIRYVANANGRGCDWLSIGGQVLDTAGNALNNYGVQITGSEDGSTLDQRVFSGSALTFGPGGFELALGSTPRQGRYQVQVFDTTGAPASEVYDLFTSDRCDQNVLRLTFRAR